MGHRIVNGIKVARAKMRAPYKPTKKNKTLTKSIDQKMAKEAEESAGNNDDSGEPQGEIV